jgi:hypothetical protein
MKEAPEQRALTASTVSLVAALACVALFLPPLVQDTIATPVRAAATGAALGVSLLLHWIFLGLAVRRMQRSLAAWLGFAVLLFPIGSAAALMLLSWFNDETGGTPAPAPHG